MDAEEDEVEQKSPEFRGKRTKKIVIKRRQPADNESPSFRYQINNYLTMPSHQAKKANKLRNSAQAIRQLVVRQQMQQSFIKGSNHLSNSTHLDPHDRGRMPNYKSLPAVKHLSEAQLKNYISRNVLGNSQQYIKSVVQSESTAKVQNFELRRSMSKRTFHMKATQNAKSLGALKYTNQVTVKPILTKPAQPPLSRQATNFYSFKPPESSLDKKQTSFQVMSQQGSFMDSNHELVRSIP